MQSAGAPRFQFQPCVAFCPRAFLLFFGAPPFWDEAFLEFIGSLFMRFWLSRGSPWEFLGFNVFPFEPLGSRAFPLVSFDDEIVLH